MEKLLTKQVVAEHNAMTSITNFVVEVLSIKNILLSISAVGMKLLTPVAKLAVVIKSTIILVSAVGKKYLIQGNKSVVMGMSSMENLLGQSVVLTNVEM
jgi:hypothetical protein